MKRRVVGAGVGLVALLGAPSLSADDLSAASALLCSSSWAVVCTAEEVCESGAPSDWDVPQFIEVDLETKVLRTTEESGENRSTPAQMLRREDGLISLHGMELGRAFSIVVSEESGRLAAAIAGDDLTITVFGACTPIDREESR